MDTNKKLEIFRKMVCFGELQIREVFADEGGDMLQHLLGKYRNSREQYGAYGNFHFLFQLDNELASKLLKRAGF